MTPHGQCTINRRDWLRLSLLLLFCCCACSRREAPQEVYDRAKAAFQKGDLAAAQEQARKGYADFHAAGSDWAWKFLILRARTFCHQGKYAEALSLMSSEPSAPPSLDLTVRKLWIEGLANTSMHQFARAEQVFREADPLCRGQESPACANIASARGTMEMERGHYAEAQTFFAQVLTPARASGEQMWLANAMLDLSWAANEQGHFDEALDWAGLSAQIAERQNFAVVREKARGNMGWAFYKLGERERAQEMFAEAEKQAKDLGDVGDQLGWLTAAAYTYMDDGEFDVAKRSFQQALDLARKINGKEDIVNSLIALAFVSEQTGKLDDAKRYSDEALEMARTSGNKRDETYPRLVQGRIAAQQHDAPAAESALHDVAASAHSPVFLKWEAERSLARLYEAMNQIKQADEEYRTALNTFETARSEVKRENSRLPFLANATHIYDDYIHFLVTRGRTDEALQIAEYSRARTLSEGLGLLKQASGFQPDALNAPQIAKRSGGVILFYWLGEKQSYLWVVARQKITLFPLPAAGEINAAVQRYRKALLGPQDALESFNSDGLGLYRTLVAPAQAMLPKDSKVFIVPDGSLNTLNFETLLVGDPAPHYWIDDVTLADASSLRLLAAAHLASTKSRKLLLMGDAVSSKTDYPELRKAAAEMESIERHFAADQQSVFARERATPAAYLASQPGQFSYLHFVAHGTASRVSPLDSAIVLSGLGTDDSFKLYARDIIRQPLRAELVTISTCYGAGARAYSGEGLVGLSWAFLRAGAHDVIGALWEVSDVSTPQLMDHLYADLQKGQSPESALRAAKLSLLHSGGSFRRPFYWAPFQLYTGS